MAKRRLYKDFDKMLVFLSLCIFAIGMLAIYSATQNRALPLGDSYILRQALWMAIALGFLLIMINVAYQRFIDASYIIYAVNIVLLILVLVVGRTRLGAQRWFSIGPFAFQPSEFIKLSLILALANYAGEKKWAMSHFRSIVFPSVLLGIPFVLVLLQPDLGTALILLPIFLSILLVSGARPKYLFGMIAIGIVCLPFFWQILHEYQRHRLLVFVNPNIDPLGAGYTIIQSKIAIGSGGLFGKGWLAGTQNQLNFLPERHTDFIFSVIGEEWGFVGVMLLVLLYFMVIKRGFAIAALTTDMYGKAIAIGASVMLSLQVIINISMTIGLMPVVGIPLPLVSYGGSSLLTTVIAIGLILNVGMRRSTF